MSYTLPFCDQKFMTSLRGVGSVTQLQLWTWRCDGLRFEKYARSQPKCSTDWASLSPSFLPSFLPCRTSNTGNYAPQVRWMHVHVRKLPGNPWIRCLLDSRVNKPRALARPNTNKWRRHGNWKWLCVRRQCMHVSFLPLPSSHDRDPIRLQKSRDSVSVSVS